MNRRKYLIGVLGATSLAGCTSFDSGNNDGGQVNNGEADLFVRYNVNVLDGARHPEVPETYMVGPQAAFAVVIENRTSETIDPDENIPVEPQSLGARNWSIFDKIPAGEEEKGYLIYVADNMDVDPSLVAASDEYDVFVERDENIDVDVEPAPKEDSETTATKTESNTSTEEAESEPQLSAPEPRFVVAKDGSGDYESVDSAIRVAKDGDVIGLKQGQYVLGAEYPTLTFVGRGTGETSLVLGERENGDVKLSSNITLWDLTATTENGDGPLKNNNKLHARRCAIQPAISGGKVTGKQSTFAQTIESNSVILKNSVAQDRVTVKEVLSANSSTFEGAVQAFDFGNYETPPVENCVFENGLISDIGTGKIAGSEIHGLACLGAQTNNLKVVDSTIHRFDDPSMFDSLGGRDAIFSRNDREPGDYSVAVTIRRCTIKGSVNYVNNTIDKFVGNKFTSDDLDWFIDGGDPDVVVANAFVGGDIRLNSQDVRVNKDEVGNYYSAFDGEDENGDGIIDLPRPIPGEAKLTDRYPLAKPDPSEYL